MKFVSRNLPQFTTILLTLVVGLSAAAAFGQGKLETKADKAETKESKGFCSNHNWSSDDKVSSSELREMNVAASGTLNVDGRQNGGVSVKGEDRSDILIRACVQAWGKSDAEARSLVSSVRIDTGSTIKADGATDNNWSVSFDIRVPRTTNLNLKAHNGGISIANVDGSAEFETLNGGVNLNGVSGSVKGKTMNGGINVKLSGPTWKGTGLDVQTTNGGVNIEVPENFAAHVEASTVNGGFNSNIAGLSVDKTTDEYGRRQRPSKVSTDINGGGPLVRAVTTNGGVRISTAGSDSKKEM